MVAVASVPACQKTLVFAVFGSGSVACQYWQPETLAVFGSGSVALACQYWQLGPLAVFGSGSVMYWLLWQYWQLEPLSVFGSGSMTCWLLWQCWQLEPLAFEGLLLGAAAQLLAVAGSLACRQLAPFAWIFAFSSALAFVLAVRTHAAFAVVLGSVFVALTVVVG